MVGDEHGRKELEDAEVDDGQVHAHHVVHHLEDLRDTDKAHHPYHAQETEHAQRLRHARRGRCDRGVTRRVDALSVYRIQSIATKVKSKANQPLTYRRATRIGSLMNALSQ